jgi:hypothetical protein
MYFEEDYVDTAPTSIPTTETVPITEEQVLVADPAPVEVAAASQDIETTVSQKAAGGAAIGLLLLIVVWGVVGFAAFITSLVCVGYSGTFGQKVIGLLLALIFGPFYFIYYGFSKTYCSSNSTQTMYGGKKK